VRAPTYGRRGGLQAFDRGSRKISHAFGKATVLTYSPKADGGIAVESESERLVAHMLNIDPEVVSYSAQPFAVELTTSSLARTEEEKDALRTRIKRYGGKATFYTPDFHLTWASGVQAAIEVKQGRFPGNAEYQRKLQLAQDILLSRGCEFLQVVTPDNWRHPLLTNLPLLHQAHMRQDAWPKPEIADRIVELQEAGATSMGDFLSGLGLDARMSPLLLVSGHLEADIFAQPLCYAIPARPAHGDLGHLQVLRRLSQ
jgi:hypothetical protein